MKKGMKMTEQPEPSKKLYPACNDIINYQWTHNPESPHNKVVS